MSERGDATAGQQATPETPPQAEQRHMRRLILTNVFGLVILIVIGFGIFYLWHQSYYFYSTDDATVSGSIATIAPIGPGTIASVNFRLSLGSNVHKGDTIATFANASGTTDSLSSPINGVIIYESAMPGEVLPAVQTVAQIVDPSNLNIKAYVEENHINEVQRGQGVDVTIDSVPDTMFHGTVTRILPVAASALSPIPSSDNANGNFTKVTQRVPVEITLDSYQGHTLYLGQSAEVTIHIHS